MTNAELIASVREKAKGLDFSIRWSVLELAARLESLRPKGKWETYPSHAYRKCSVCKMEFDKPKFNIRANFCPNCGADMRGEG